MSDLKLDTALILLIVHVIICRRPLEALSQEKSHFLHEGALDFLEPGKTNPLEKVC